MAQSSPSVVWLYPEVSGQAFWMGSRLAVMQQLCSKGWRVSLATTKSPELNLDKRVRVVELPRPGIYIAGPLLFHLAFQLWLVRHTRRVDVLMLDESSLPFMLPFVFLRRVFRGIKTLVVVDSRTLPMVTGSGRAKLRENYFALSQRLANRYADGQTAITQRLATAVQIPSRKLLGVWSSCVRPEPFREARRSRTWPGPDDPVRLIYVGTFDGERGLLQLAKAVRMVYQEGENVRLTLVGCAGGGRGSTEVDELESYVGRWDDGVISVCPPVAPDAVPGLLASAHVGVLPFPDMLKFRVSSPIKLFEYMASGMAVLATRIACHTDVLKSDYAIWAQDSSVEGLAAAVREVCARKADLPEMGARVGRAAHEWTDEAAAEKLSAALRRALSSAAPGRTNGRQLCVNA